MMLLRFTFVISFIFCVLSIYSDERIPSFALKDSVKRKTFFLDTLGASHVIVRSENDFNVKTDSRPVVFELKNNIVVHSPIRFRGIRTYYIKGNGFSVFEPDIAKPSRSVPYQAKLWSLDKENKRLTIKLKHPIDLKQFKVRDSIYVVYEGWFLRFKEKMVSLSDSCLIFRCGEKFLSNRKFFTLTPFPYFYLEENPENSINIRNLLVVTKGTKLLIDNVSFQGFSSSCISNSGVLKVFKCCFSGFEKECISSNGELFVEDSKFSDITSYCVLAKPKSYLDIVDSEFKNVGLRGSNSGCVYSRGNSYIGNNRFIDFNYSAILLGMRTKNKERPPSAIVENNLIAWTLEWEKQMSVYGLTDGGAIYVSTCSKRTIIRNNTILNFGGHRANRAIYCDDGAFNVTIYGNVIKGTRNSYDIDSRDCSKTWKKQGQDSIPCPNTGNYIGFNICDGKLKLEGASAISDNGCVFENNIIVGRKDERKDIVNNNRHVRNAIIYDLQGRIDDKGKVLSKKCQQIKKIKAPTL